MNAILPFRFLQNAVRFVVHLVRFWWIGRNHSDMRVLGCYPRPPLPLYMVWSMAHVSGIALIPGVSDYTMLCMDRTRIDLKRLPHDARSWINGRCLDISKSFVSEVFTQVSGRTLLVEPRKYEGDMVEKLERNGSHSGRIVAGPLRTARKGCVYQKLIRNEIADGIVEDLRTVIVGGAIPLVYRKRRQTSRRFKPYSPSVGIVDPSDVFSDEEQDLIRRFSRAVGLDFGELDVLRDSEDGQIYIVDVNNTPISPPVDLPFDDRLGALQMIGAMFRRELLR